MKRKHRRAPSRTPAEAQQRRVLILTRLTVLGLSAIMLALLGRVIQLQHDPTEPIEQRIGTHESTSRIPARRGALLDARGRALAISRLGRRLFVDPKLIEDSTSFAAHLAHAIGGDPARIDRLIHQRPGSRYVVIEPLLDEEQLEAVRQLDMPAVATELRPVRHYPQGETAGRVIGFVGVDHTGLEGIEFALDSVLRGDPGSLEVLRDVRRRPLWAERSGYKPPRNGHNVRLSIDVMIQRIAEEELATAAEKYKPKRAEAVVMHAETGQLLAMANWPGFDPDGPKKKDSTHRRNRCVTDAYEPGSVFKPFLHAKATAAGLARPEQMIDTTEAGVWHTENGRRLRDAHGHGTITWNEVLVLSSNIGMGKVCKQLGPKRMHDAVEDFGFGRTTGTALPGESPGILNPLSKWTSYSLTSIPMGQEIAATPVQLVRGFSTFANDGLMVSPSVLAVEAESPIYQRALDEQAARHTRKLLRRVVTDGTGSRAQSEKYRIWGKTGTAQVPDHVNGGYKPRTYSSSFLSGAPLRDPKLIVLVAVHEPDPDIGYYGGIVSAPVAKRIIERTLPYLGVAPDHPDANPSSPDSTIASNAGN